MSEPAETEPKKRKAKAGATESPPVGPLLQCQLPGWRTFRDVSDAGGGQRADDRRALDEYLLASLQVQHVLVLAGSGASVGAGGPTMQALWDKAAALPGFEQARSATRHGAARDIEELLSRCDALLQIDETASTIGEFRQQAISMILEACRQAGASGTTETHEQFLKKLARRRARDSRLKIFTTNYDLCFEEAASKLGLITIDGFSFSTPRRFDPRHFDYDVVRRDIGGQSATFLPNVLQFFKLHGSVHWAARGNRIEIDHDVEANEACLIYPARTKFQRSYVQPHLELVARYLAALREPNTCLVVVGFGFADDHLTAPILAALDANPHFRLIVVDRDADDHLVKGKGHWKALGAASKHADVAFVAGTFDAFVPMIPDLRALSPAEELAHAVRAVAEKR